MEDGVIQRVSELIEDSGKSVAKFAEGIGIAQSALFKYLNGINKPSLALVYGVLESDKNVSSEWLLRGEGNKYKTDVPRDGDSEEIEDLRIELTKVHAERDELRQVVEDLKRQAKEWRESDEYKQTFAELRAEAAELRARLDEQRTNFRVLAESIGRQPQQPVITGTIPRIKLPHAVAATAAANMAAGVPVALAIGDAENLPGAFAAKATKSKKNIG
jgi:transcriptional regulator with XRE-family HTH domain